MKHFDLVVIGGHGGPCGLSVLHKYRKKDEECVFLTEDSQLEGAATKGVKLVNPVITKLPLVFDSDKRKEGYEEIGELVMRSEILLEEFMGKTNAYMLNASQLGVRHCVHPGELNVLRGTRITEVPLDNQLYNQINTFSQENFALGLDRDLLFSYEERVWNVNGYLKILVNMLTEYTWPVSSVEYFESKDDKVFLKVTELDKEKVEIISASKVIVCKGIGNIDFERKITKEINFSDLRILPYYKAFNQSKIPIPVPISSLCLPEISICLTNEQSNNYSLLYDINESPKKVEDWDDLSFPQTTPGSRDKVFARFPSVKEALQHDFMCAMAVDSTAFRKDPKKYFEIIRTKSKIPNIHYANLTYFTAIRAAVQSLPNDLKEF